MQNIAPAEQIKVKEYLLAGQKIAAIKYYRSVSGCDLTEAKTRIDAYIAQEHQVDPHAFPNLNANKTVKKNKSLIMIILVLVVLIVINLDWARYTGFKSFEAFKYYMLDQEIAQDIKRFLSQYIDFEEPQKTNTAEQRRVEKPVEQKKSPKKTIAKTTKYSKTALQILADSPRPHKQAQKVYPTKAMPASQSTMQKIYQKKLANYDYQDWKSLAGLPKGFQDFPEEIDIKKLRSQYASKQIVPDHETAYIIPRIDTNTPLIDGKISGKEWQQALKLDMLPLINETRLYLIADKQWLYIAADVPQERTKKGFDQLRFSYHVNLIPEIKNERIHVGGYGLKARKLGGIRQTTIRWFGDAPENHEQRWKKYKISDWQIYQHAKGASYLEEWRQYEAKILLEEVGLHTGIAFAAYAVVETDPLRKPNGKFKKRQYLGRLGEQKTPIWLIIK